MNEAKAVPLIERLRGQRPEVRCHWSGYQGQQLPHRAGRHNYYVYAVKIISEGEQQSRRIFLPFIGGVK